MFENQEKIMEKNKEFVTTLYKSTCIFEFFSNSNTCFFYYYIVIIYSENFTLYSTSLLTDSMRYARYSREIPSKSTVIRVSIERDNESARMKNHVTIIVINQSKLKRVF